MTAISVLPACEPTTVRHDRLTIALHWITAFLVLSQFASAHIWEFLVRGTPLRLSLISLHISFGILLAVTIIIRIAWRIANRSRIPASGSGVQHLAAHAVYLLLYGLLVLQLVLGFAFSWTSGKPLPFFSFLSIPPFLTIDPDWRHDITELHSVVSWIIMGVVGLHAAAALVHHYVIRDGVLLRMMPGR